jgi:hypothetical protein
MNRFFSSLGQLFVDMFCGICGFVEQRQSLAIDPSKFNKPR